MIAFSRTAWRRVLRRPEPDVVFPPPAWRPGAGVLQSRPAVPAQRASASAPHTSVPTAVAPGPASTAASGLFFAAVGVAVYAGGVVVLLATGAAEELFPPSVGWVTRHIVVAALAATALLAERVLSKGREAVEGRERLATALVGMGAAWVALGVVDQHLFGLFEVAGGDLTWDVLFHGSGSLAVAIGWALHFAPGREAWASNGSVPS